MVFVFKFCGHEPFVNGGRYLEVFLVPSVVKAKFKLLFYCVVTDGFEELR